MSRSTAIEDGPTRPLSKSQKLNKSSKPDRVTFKRLRQMEESTEEDDLDQNLEDQKDDDRPRTKKISKWRTEQLTEVDDYESNAELHCSQSDSSSQMDYLPVKPEAISHKEQRKRRKLEKRKQAESGTDNQAQDDLAACSSRVVSSSKVESIFTTNARSKYGVWVGNMLFTTTPQELHAFFEPCGKVTRLNMPTGKREFEHNKGYAYVDFETELGCEKAIEKTEGMLGGRKLLIKRSTDYTGRPARTVQSVSSSDPQGSVPVIPTPTVSKTVRKILDRQKQAPAPCIYLGNLGFETTPQSIIAMFEAHHRMQEVWKPKSDAANQENRSSGPSNQPTAKGAGIRKVRMGTFEDSGKCKGFAFVDFFSVQQATDALVNVRNHTLDGRNLTVEYASSDAVRRGGGNVKSTPRRGSPTRNNRSTDCRPVKRPCFDVQSSNAMPEYKIDPVFKPKLSNPEPTYDKFVSLDDFTPTEKKIKKEFKGRQKPGAALANARRAPTGIVKNPEVLGTKIVFD